MKLNLLALGYLVTAAAIFAADPSPPAAPAPPSAAATPAADGKPELRGVLSTATEKRFNLSLSGTGHSEWVTVGEKFGDWKLAEFKAADQTLILRKDDGTELDLALVDSHVAAGDSKATLAESEAVLEKMKFSKIVDAALAPQRKAFLDAVQKIATRAGLTPASGEAYTAFQQKANDLISSALDPKQMESDLAQIYSNTYSKEELAGLGDFFDSPVGQTYAAKAPDVQKQLQAIMLPRLMAIAPQLQTLAKQSAPAPAATAAPVAP